MGRLCSRGDEHIRLAGGFVHTLAGDQRCSLAHASYFAYTFRMIEKTCEVCQSAFRVKPYRAKRARFCSMSCRSKWQAETFLNAAPKTHLIGNKFRAGKRPANAFRSEDVRGSAHIRWQDGLALTCEHCGAPFNQKPWLARQNGVARFCSTKCAGKAKPKGENAPDWVGGPRTYRGRGWLAARAAVVQDQGGDCAECGEHVGKSLPVHHIKPFRLFNSAESANARKNLVGLCQSCHMRHEYQNRPS